MSLINRRTFIAASALALSASSALAQFPDRMLKIISPAPPGGSTDIMSRLLQPGIQDLLKQTVIVESRGGAGGYIGSDAVAKSPADGYTLLLGGAFVANTALLKKKPAYDPRKDLVPVAMFASVPNLLVAGPKLRAKNVAELITESKANPDRINVGSNGVGTTIHLASELFKVRTGASFTHVPFRGWSDCMVALVNGEVDIMFDNLNTAMPNIIDGKLRPFAVTAKQRHASLPDVPTLEELGVKDADVTAWFGLMVPANTPKPVIDKLGQTFKAISETPDFKRLIAQQGMDPVFIAQADAEKFWLSEIDRWEVIIRGAGIEQQD